MAENTVAVDLAVRILNADSVKELKAILKEVQDQLDESSDNIADHTSKLNGYYDKLKDKIEQLQTSLKEHGAEEKMASLVELSKNVETGFHVASTAVKVFGYSNEELEVAIGKVHQGVVALQGAQAALNFIMEASPIGLMVTAAAALVAIVIYLSDTTEKARELQHKQNETLEETIKKNEQKAAAEKKAGEQTLERAQIEKQSIDEIARIKHDNNNREQAATQQHINDLNALIDGQRKEQAKTTDKESKKKLDDLIKSENDQIEIIKQKGEELIIESKRIEQERQDAIQSIREQATKLHIENITDAHQREIAALKEELAERLTAIRGHSPEEESLRKELTININEKISAVNRKYDLEDATVRNKLAIEATKEGSQERIKVQEAAIRNELEIELKNISLSYNQRLLLIKEAEEKIAKLENESAKKKSDNEKIHLEADLKMAENAAIAKQNAAQLEAASRLTGEDQRILKEKIELENKNYEEERKAALEAGRSVEKIEAEHIAHLQKLTVDAGQKKLDSDAQVIKKKLQQNKKQYEDELKQLQSEGLDKKQQKELQASAKLSGLRKKEMDTELKVAEANYRIQQQAAGNNADQLQKVNEDYEKNKLDIQARYGKQQLDQEQKDAQAKQKLLEDGLSAVQSVGTLLGAEGKKQKEIKKGLALAHIAIDTARAIGALTAAANENPFNGPTAGIAGIAQFATGIAEILSNVAQAKQILSGADDESGASSGSAAAPSVKSEAGSGGSASSSLYNAAQPSLGLTPQVNTPAQATAINRDQAQKSGVNAQGVRVYVTETDITSTQKRVGKLHRGSVM